MKKFICMIVFTALVFTLTGCAHKHVFNEANCSAPKTCTDCGYTEGTKIKHDTTNGKCSMCGLDYYEVLKDLIKKEGVKGDDSAFSYAYSYLVEKEDYTFLLAITKKGSIKLQVSKVDGAYIKTYEFFQIEFNGGNIKKQEYDWNYEWVSVSSYSYSEEEISGQLYAPDFLYSTSALSYSNSSASSSSKANQYAKDASKMLKFALEQIQILMDKGDQDLSLFNLGFEYFE